MENIETQKPPHIGHPLPCHVSRDIKALTPFALIDHSPGSFITHFSRT
jgi:hypothetical protein